MLVPTVRCASVSSYFNLHRQHTILPFAVAHCDQWYTAHTGLDARAAAIVMRTVRNIVNTGRTIVCTIHQPSIDIFEAFDELLLLKRGGECIFNGQLGKDSSRLIDYFSVSVGAVTCLVYVFAKVTFFVDNSRTQDWLGFDLSLVNDQLGIGSGCLELLHELLRAQYHMLPSHVLLTIIGRG